MLATNASSGSAGQFNLLKTIQASVSLIAIYEAHNILIECLIVWWHAAVKEDAMSYCMHVCNIDWVTDRNARAKLLNTCFSLNNCIEKIHNCKENLVSVQGLLSCIQMCEVFSCLLHSPGFLGCKTHYHLSHSVTLLQS